MSAAHVRRGSGNGRKRGKPTRGKVTVPRKLVDKLPVQQDSANRVARWAFGLFAAAAVAVALVALDIPPYFIAEEIEDLPLTPRHLVWRDGDLDKA